MQPQRFFGRRRRFLFTTSFHFDWIFPIAVVCAHLKHGFDLLSFCFHQYGCVAELVGLANAIDGVFVGYPYRSSTIKDVLDLIDSIHTGNSHHKTTFDRTNYRKKKIFDFQVVVLVKCIAPLFLWLDKNPIPIPENNPMAAPRIIGVEVKANHATYDLILLLVVFFHR